MNDRKIRFHLKTLIAQYEDRTGESLPYRTLSERTGLSTSTISRIANNEVTMLHFETGEKLCDFFDCDLEDLLCLEPEYEVKQPDE